MSELDDNILLGSQLGIPANYIGNKSFADYDRLYQEEERRVRRCQERRRNISYSYTSSYVSGQRYAEVVKAEEAKNREEIELLKQEFIHFKEWSYSLENEINIYLFIKRKTNSAVLKVLADGRMELARDSLNNTEELLNSIRNDFKENRIVFDENIVTRDACRKPEKKQEIASKMLATLFSRLKEIPESHKSEAKKVVEDLGFLNSIVGNNDLIETVIKNFEATKTSTLCQKCGTTKILNIPYCLGCGEIV